MFKTIAKAGVAGLALAGFITTAQATGASGDGSWAGAYVGGHAGGGRGDADISANFFLAPQIDPNSEDRFDLEGWLAGAHIGANAQMGAWVIGGELSLSAADISGSRSPECATNTISAEIITASVSFPCQKDDEWLALGMARFGYAPGSWMGYVTLGVAVVGSQTNNGLLFSQGGQSSGPIPVNAGSSTDVGFAIGGGMEGQLGHGLILGLEYIHADFDDMRDGTNSIVFDYSQDIDIVRARLSMMLDSCCGEAAGAPSKFAGGYAGILPATGNTWSGVYFGGHVGGGWAETDIREEAFGIAGTDSLDLDGWLAGVHLGGMVQRGDFVFGTELSLSGAGIDGSKGENCADLGQEGGNFGCRKEDEWLLLAMSRIGYAPSNWMAYVTYGLAVVGAQADRTVNITDEGVFGLPFSSGVNTDVGFAIGGGAEIKLGSGIIAGAEYIHADLDGARNGVNIVTEWDQDIDIVRARLSMMLNACCDAPAGPSKMNMASAGAAAGWGGFYFGSNLAYGWADTDVSLEVFQNGTTFEKSFDLEGYLAGAHLGGNVQIGALVLGGELSVSAGEVDGSREGDCLLQGAEEPEDFEFGCKKEDEWLALAMGRLGYAPGSWMAYVTAGAAVVGFQTDTSAEGSPFSAGSDTDLGYAIGGGAEFQLGHGLIAGVEYIHAEFDGARDGGGEGFVPEWEQDMDLVRGRLSYKFGGCCGAAPAAVPFK